MVTNFHKKKKGGMARRWLVAAGGVALMLLVVYLLVTDISLYKKKKEFLAQVSNLQGQMDGLQSSNTNLKEEIANSDNPDYIEKVAREKLDLQQPDEKVVSFVLPQSSTTVNATSGRNVFQVILDQIGGAWHWMSSNI